MPRTKALPFVVAAALALGVAGYSQAQRKPLPIKYKRVEQLPEGEQISFKRGFLPSLSDSSMVKVIMEAPYEKVWIAAEIVAKRLDKLGGRRVVNVDQEMGRIQNGAIDINAAIGATTFDWMDEFVTEITKESDSRTIVSVTRRIVQAQLYGAKEWKAEPSNGDVERWIVTQIADETDRVISGESTAENTQPQQSNPIQPTGAAITNADVIKLVEASLPEAVILAKIRNSPCAFDTSVDALIALKDAGVTPAIIQAMAEANCAAPEE